MARITTNPQHYADIGAAIRTRLNTTQRYAPSEMAAAIGGITGAAVSAIDPSKALSVPVSGSLVTTDNQYYGAIADAIRAKNGTAATYKPEQMAAAILAISSVQGYTITINLPDGVEAEILSGDEIMQSGELLSLKVTSKTTGFLLDTTMTAAMGGSAVDLSEHVTIGFTTYDGLNCKSYTIENLPITGDFTLNVTGRQMEQYLFEPVAINGAVGEGGFRQEHGSVRVWFAPDAGYGVPSAIWNTWSELQNSTYLEVMDANTGEQIPNSTYGDGRWTGSIKDGKYYLLMQSLPARDLIIQVTFVPI